MKNHPAIMIALLVVATAGCIGTVPSDGTTTTQPPSSTTTTASCTEYDIVPPEKPATLDADSAEQFVRTFEKRYQTAGLRSTYENVAVTQVWWRETTTNRTENGFRVTVNLQLSWSSEEYDATGGYNATYTLTSSEVRRDGRALDCWE